ncbi:MAG: bifunctional oligoribonuclease/PAP phosphatase NrnA [Bacilli bacterium]
MNNIYKQIYKKIKQYDNIVIARHIGPDPDAIASEISLRDSIKATFPNKNVYAIGTGVSKFKFYGTLDKTPEANLKKTLLITCDVPGVLRIDGANTIDYAEVIKIDHHPFEESFGGIEWIDTTATSVSQMLIELIFNTKLLLTKKVAENLFLGVISDSDRFLLSYTSSKTFYLISRLIEETKIDFVSLYHNLYERPIAEVKFQSFLANNMIITENGLGYVKITSADLKEYGVDTATPSNMINSFNFIKEVYVWTFITYDEKNEIFKINIRSRGPVINEVAGKYNGGGHKFASGVRTTDERDIENLLNDLDCVCKQYVENNND